MTSQSKVFITSQTSIFTEIIQARSFFGQEQDRNIVVRVVKSHTNTQTIHDKWERYFHLGNQVVDSAA